MNSASGTDASLARPTRLAAVQGLIRAIAEVDPAAMESAARQLGESRRYLAPVAWAAGTIVLLIDGIKLLIMNWRLSLIQVVPAAWVWLATWNLKRHLVHGASFGHFDLFARLGISIGVVALSIAAFWCNTVFAYAIDGPPPPLIAPAARRAQRHWPLISGSGVVVGGALAFAVVVVPRFFGVWVFSLTLGIVLGVMLISFVAVPARIIGAKKSDKLSPKEALGRAAAGGALSAVAMAPGFVLDRVGLILLGVPGLHAVGFALLSIGTALYAAGMSSVKAVKLSMKLSPATASQSPGPATASQSPGPAAPASPSPGPATASHSPGPATAAHSPGPATASQSPGPTTASQSPGPAAPAAPAAEPGGAAAGES